MKALKRTIRVAVVILILAILLLPSPEAIQDTQSNPHLPLTSSLNALVNTGAFTEIKEARSRYAKIFQVSAETRMAQISMTPIHYQDKSGKWQAIDMRIGPSAQSGFDLEATQNDYQVYFKGSSASPYLLRYETGGGQIEFGIEAQQAWGTLNDVKAKAIDNRVEYDGLFPGVQLRYQLFPREMLEEFIVSNRALATNISQIQKRLSVRGIDWAMAADGSVTFTRKGTAQKLWSIPKPVMYELNNPRNSSQGIHFEVVEEAGYYQLVKVIEPAGRVWLTDQQRQFPVVLDDTVVLNDQNVAGGEGTVVNSPASYYRRTDNSNIGMGKDSSLGLVYRGFLEWDTTAIPAGVAIQALGIYFHVNAGYGLSNTVNITQLPQPISSYTNDASGNQQLFTDIGTAGIYDINLPSFQKKGDNVISLGYDTYPYNTAISDFESKLTTHAPFGIGLVGSNEADAFATIFSNVDVAHPDNHPALIVFYGGIKGSATAMIRPLRNSFFDGTYYWAFFRSDYNVFSGQYAYYSRDGSTWTRVAQLSSSSNQHHSEWYTPGGTVWAAYASQIIGAYTDMDFRKGTITYTPTVALTWDQPTAVFTGTRIVTATQDGFDFPTIIKDSNNYCWLLTRHVTITTSGIEIAQSTDPACSGWQPPTVLLVPQPNGGDSGVGAYVVPLTNGKLYVVIKNQYALSGMLYDGLTWSQPEIIDNNAAFGVYSQGMSIVSVGDVVHLVYIGGDGSLKYNSRNGGWGTAITLDSAGPFWSPSLSLDTAHADLYVVYRTSSVNTQANGGVFYRKGSSPYSSANWGPANLVTASAYAPETIFGAVSPGSTSPWSISTNYAGNGVNFAIFVDGAFGLRMASMNHVTLTYLPLIAR